MTDSPNAPHARVLKVFQQAVCILARWAGAQLSPKCRRPDDDEAITRAKELLSWPSDETLRPLRLLFDAVQLPNGTGQTAEYYWPIRELADQDPLIPYPVQQVDQKGLEELRRTVQPELQPLAGNDWQNVSLLVLLVEKFGFCLSLGETNVALFDLAKATAAVAAALTENPKADQLCLVAGDLSGIQTFIYTISSDGALKSLRARSFYLELVTEEITQQLLQALDLPRTNVIYAGGGNLYLLAPAQNKTEAAVKRVRELFNQWLFDEFQGKVFLGLDCCQFPTKDVGTAKFADHWETVIKRLAIQKNRKFDRQLNQLLAIQASHEPCKVCHRDDVKRLAPLNPLEPTSPEACPTCGRMFRLGGQLLRVEAIARSKKRSISRTFLRLKLRSGVIYYNLFNDCQQAIQATNATSVLLINNWSVRHYRQASHTVPFLLGNYGQSSDEDFNEDKRPGFITAAEMAERSRGIQRVGYLRMDVDRLGQIFAKGLEAHHTLPRLAGLSRQMSYFFKVYLNSLAKQRTNNLPKTLSVPDPTSDRPNLLFIYAGGDDLFVSGTWNEVVEFAFDVYQSFRAYTGQHPDITLSGGISLSGAKYPLYQAAADAGEAEKHAKNNGRDSLGLSTKKMTFKWREWIGAEGSGEENVAIIHTIEGRDEEYWKMLGSDLNRPTMIGILPFVQKILRGQLEPNYSRNLVRNLLATAQLQEQKIEDIDQKRRLPEYEHQIQDIRYYLHLPQIAYTLARLPKQAFDDTFRQSLKSPYNAPYFRAIATWIELLTRNKSES